MNLQSKVYNKAEQMFRVKPNVGLIVKIPINKKVFKISIYVQNKAKQNLTFIINSLYIK